MRKRWFALVAVGVVVVLAGGAAIAAQEFGLFVENKLRSESEVQFGVNKPLAASSTQQITQQQAQADPTKLVTLAKSLSARVVTTSAGPIIDQMALWPSEDDPQYLIACNESGTTDPGLQRININTGAVATIVTGTTSCDPVRKTPWGTILFGEEAGGGAQGGSMYELIDPLNTTGVTLDRTTGLFTGGTNPQNLVRRDALGKLSFEGLTILANGVTYYGDENRPSNGTPGGAYFKFIPSTLSSGPAATLAQSPYATGGTIYGLRLGRRGGVPGNDYGQGTETGFGTWMQICTGAPCNNIDLRAQAASLKLTGYYRPEDEDIDRAQLAQNNVRFCGTNTGNENEDQDYGEVICFTDGTVSQATANTGVPEGHRFVEGSPAFAMPDNVAYQQGRGNWVIHEDAETTYLTPHNNDLWDCLPDGNDEDLLSDGCVRVGTLNDLTAEWTGGIFNQQGTRFFVSVQHNISGQSTVLEITGWK
jgi:secreted PhoX family phosphatase